MSKNICPYCNSFLEEGTIVQERGLAAWTPLGYKKPFLFPVVMGKSIIIVNTSDGPLGGSKVQAYLCRQCAKIIIDISECL